MVEHEREHAPQLRAARRRDQLELPDAEDQDGERPVIARGARLLLREPLLVVGVRVGANEIVLDGAGPRSLVRPRVVDGEGRPVRHDSEPVESDGIETQEGQAGDGETPQEGALAPGERRGHEEGRALQLLGRRNRHEVAQALRLALTDGEPREPFARIELRERRGRAFGGPQPQDVAVEQIELARIGLEKSPRRLGNGRIEAIDVEGLEGLGCRVQVGEGGALVGHAPLELVLGLGGGHEAHGLVRELILELADALPEPLRFPPPLLPDGAQEKARAQEQKRGDIGLQALHHAPRQVFGSAEPAGELEARHHESGHDPFAKPVARRDDRDEGEGGIGLPAQKADVVRQEEDIDDGEQDDPGAELEEIGVDAVRDAAHPALTAPGRRPARRTGARPCPGQWTGPRSIVPPAATTIRSARSSRSTPGPRWRRR